MQAFCVLISSEKEMFTVRKQTNRIFSILLTLVMLLSLLPAPAQAIGKDPIIPVPTTLAFTTEPQSGTVLNTEDYTATWATNKTPHILLLEIMEINRLSEAITWEAVGSPVEPTGKSGTITVEYPSSAAQRPNGLSTYRLTVGYQGTEVETATCTFTVTWISGCRVSFDANGGTGTMASEICAVGEEYKELVLVPQMQMMFLI